MKKLLLTHELFTEKICNGTYSALKLLIESCYYSQISSLIVKGTIGDMAWWKEYCTIRMTCSRGSGHTSALAKVIPEYFNKSLILCVNQDIAERTCGIFARTYSAQMEGKKTITFNGESLLTGESLLKQTKYKIITENSEYDFATVNSLDNYKGMDFQAIVVDVACMLSNNKIDEIYERMGPSMQKHSENFFIFVE